ncbi:hypothetical protein IKA15_01750 [bacterium]|nr:hypothetical protein [bacterium]
MKNFLKYFGYSVLGLLVVAYLAFLFVLPNVVHLENYTQLANDFLKQNYGMTFSWKNPKITTNPLLSVGLKAEDIKLFMPDNSVLFSADAIKTRIALPSLLALTVKVSCVELDKPFVNIESNIEKGKKQYKIVRLIEEIYNNNTKFLQEGVKDNQKEQNFSWIRIKVPNVKLNNYAFQIKDTKTGEKLVFSGEKFKAGYFNGKNVKAKTIAELKLNDKKMIGVDLDINSALPVSAPKDEEDDKLYMLQIPFYDVIGIYKNYNVKANIASKLKIKNSRRGFVSRGYLNIDDFEYNLASYTLPKSYFHTEFLGKKLKFDSNIYLSKKDKAQIFAFVRYGRFKGLDLTVKTDKIHISDLIKLAHSALNASQIKNNLDTLKTAGYIQSDFNLRASKRRVKSQGYFKINNGWAKFKSSPLKIADLNSDVLFNGDELKIANTNILINDTRFNLKGTIDSKTNTDLAFDLENLPLSKLFTALAEPAIRRNYGVKSGSLYLKGTTIGKFNKLNTNINLDVKNLNIADKLNNLEVKNSHFATKFEQIGDKYTGQLSNSDFRVLLKNFNSYLLMQKLNIVFDKNKIQIEPSHLEFNKNSKIKFEGNILDYAKKPLYDFNSEGLISTADLQTFLGEDSAVFIDKKGNLPLVLSFKGDDKKQTLDAAILANHANYITPVDMATLKGRESELRFLAVFKGDRIKIKDTGISIIERIPSEKDENKIDIVRTPVLKVAGTLQGEDINLLQITLPSKLSGSLVAFKGSEFDIAGKLLITGKTTNPHFRGGFNVAKLNIPQLRTKLDELNLAFFGTKLDLVLRALDLDNSKINMSLKMPVLPQGGNIIIENFNLDSRFIDTDKVLKILDDFAKITTPKNPKKVAQNAAPQDIPVVLQKGRILIWGLKSGDIQIRAIRSRLSLRRNILYLNNLVARAFKGRINGDISVNLLNSKLGIKLAGTGLDIEKMLYDVAKMKDAISGELDFDTNISLQGATYEEQVKSLAGDVNFIINKGQFGPFGRLENLILAENIRNSEFFQTALGSVINSLASIDTSHFEKLVGTINFNDGVANLIAMDSTGNTVSFNIFGHVDILANTADIRFRGRLASMVSDALGPIAAVNPINLIKNTPGLNVAMQKAFFLFCEEVTQEEMDKIPNFASDAKDYNATKFQIILRGDLAKPLTLVKSFKWLALASEIGQAQEFASLLIDEENDTPEEIRAKKKALKEKEKNSKK